MSKPAFARTRHFPKIERSSCSASPRSRSPSRFGNFCPNKTVTRGPSISPKLGPKFHDDRSTMYLKRARGPKSGIQSLSKRSLCLYQTHLGCGTSCVADASRCCRCSRKRSPPPGLALCATRSWRARRIRTRFLFLPPRRASSPNPGGGALGPRPRASLVPRRIPPRLGRPRIDDWPSARSLDFDHRASKWTPTSVDSGGRRLLRGGFSERGGPMRPAPGEHATCVHTETRLTFVTYIDVPICRRPVKSMCRSTWIIECSASSASGAISVFTGRRRPAWPVRCLGRVTATGSRSACSTPD